MFASVVNQVTNDLEAGGIDSLVNSIKKLADIPKIQYAANQSVIQQNGDKLIQALNNSIKKNAEFISPQLALGTLLNKTSTQLPKTQGFSKFNNDMARITNVLKKTNAQNNLNEAKQQVQVAIQNRIFQQAKRQSDVAMMKFTNQKTLRVIQNVNPIQKSVQSIKGLLNQKLVSMTTPSQVPKSVSFLSKFAALQRKIPIGQVTQRQGLSYVGLQKIEFPDGRVQYVQSKLPQIKKTQLPNIPMQFKYHATKTINSWNNFVKQEAKLVNFVSQISSQEKRSQYVQRQFRNLTIQTFMAENLATLVYYYVYIPFEKFASRPGQINQNIFYENYKTGTSTDSNPLLISSTTGLKICQRLLNKNQNMIILQSLKPSALLTAINTILSSESVANEINKKQISKFQNRPQLRQIQARAFFSSNGIDKNVFQKLLNDSNFSSVKKKRFIINDGLKNNKFISIVSKITNKQDKKNELWDYNWSSQSIPCHDYIWNT